MKRKYTIKEYKQTLFEVLRNGYSHISELKKELGKFDIKSKEDIEKLSQEDRDKFQSLVLVSTVINDLIHPGHNVSYNLFKDKDMHKFIDFCKEQQAFAFKEKAVEECSCSSCLEKDGTESN